MKITFCGFNLKQDRAVVYKKIEITGKEQPQDSDHKIAQIIKNAILKGCNFVSIRFIEKEA